MAKEKRKKGELAALAWVWAAHDDLSDALEDTGRDGEAVRDVAVSLLDALNSYYQYVGDGRRKYAKRKEAV